MWKLRNVLIIHLLSTLSIHAQEISISGHVKDASTGEDLPFANVFLNNTTLGSTTEVNGDFKINHVPEPAVYDLIISFVGYTAQKIRVNQTDLDVSLGEILLKPSEIELGAVEVTSSKDKEWERKLKKFRKIFLGEDKEADQCEILNPWVIDFGNENGQFVAKASTPIEIQNKALGYKLSFYLNAFQSKAATYLIEGNARFEEIQTADSDQVSTWRTNREKSYLHSRQHLFRAMIEHRIHGAGFDLYTDVVGYEGSTTRGAYFHSELGKTVQALDTSLLVNRTKAKDVYSIRIPGRVEVHYRNEKVPIRIYRDVFGPVSWLTSNEAAILVNKEGVELNPADLTVAGSMADERVAHLLPLNYAPLHTSAREVYAVSDILPFLREDIYIHTDKPYYYPGEIIWMKGYINYSSPSLRDSLSQIVHIELIDSVTSAVKLSRNLKVENGTFHGDIMLPEWFIPGAYYLRAYTNLNRNFGDDDLYMKPLPILDLTDKVDPMQKKVKFPKDSVLTLRSDREVYTTRQKIELILNLQDEEGHPLGGNLSVSVTDVSQVVPVHVGPDISDYYPVKAPTIDWSKKELLYPIEYGVTFSAIYHNPTGEPRSTALNVIQVKPPNFLMASSDELGRFEVSGLQFYDTATYVVRSATGKGPDFGSVELVPPVTPPVMAKQPVSLLKIQVMSNSQRIRPHFKFEEGATILKEVTVSATKVDDPRKFRPYGQPNFVLSGKDINPRYGNLLVALPGKVPGLVIRQANNFGEGPKWVVYISSAASSSILNPKEVLVMINNVAVGGDPGEILSTIDPSIVESIEVKTRLNNLLGSIGGSGVVNILTKEMAPDNRVQEQMNIIKVKGFDEPHQFDAPDYSKAGPDSGNADYRSTLYWNPDISIPAETGTFRISFFAADTPGQYRVEAEGMTDQGKPVHMEYFLKVTGK